MLATRLLHISGRRLSFDTKASMSGTVGTQSDGVEIICPVQEKTVYTNTFIALLCRNVKEC
jgi:hypothetical protein